MASEKPNTPPTSTIIWPHQLLPKSLQRTKQPIPTLTEPMTVSDTPKSPLDSPPELDEKRTKKERFFWPHDQKKTVTPPHEENRGGDAKSSAFANPYAPSLVKPTKPRKSLAHLKGFLHFLSEIFHQKLESLLDIDIPPSVTYDYDSLLESEAGFQISSYLFDSRMNCLFGEGYLVYPELCLEFFSTFSVAPIGLQKYPDLHAKGTVQFRLCGRWFHLSIDEFGNALGDVWNDTKQLDCGFREDWTVDEAYRKLCEDTQAPPHPTSEKLRDPHLLYANRFLAVNLSGRNPGDAHLMTRTELYILQCMVKK